MNKPSLPLLGAVFIILAALPSSSSGADCTGPWQKIPGYTKSMGHPCRALGLDSNRGTCRPGDAYETLCDDTTEGRYRTCQGPERCGADRPEKSRRCREWDFVYDEPCPEGYVNVDCKGHCERTDRRRDCSNWDFEYNRPCPEGYVNPDCRGRCEPDSFFNR